MMNALALRTIPTLEPLEDDEELTRGSRLGPYIIRRLLTYGGMSRIYLAYDEYSYETVAIKVVSTQGLSRGEAQLQVEQIRRERQVMRSLNALQHPNLLPLLDAGRKGSYHYLVMPYVRGGSLQDRLDREYLSPTETTPIFEQVASAVDAMHTHCLLHRDIKPANILLGEDGTVYLADFGLATGIGEPALEALIEYGERGERGRVVGTPLYMSPELCSGHASVSSDIYALGVLLYQMLAGQLPFDGPSARHICLSQMRELPTPPSQFNVDIPHSVEQVILCALEKEVTDRYATVSVFLDAYTHATRRRPGCNKLDPYTLVFFSDKPFSIFRSLNACIFP